VVEYTDEGFEPDPERCLIVRWEDGTTSEPIHQSRFERILAKLFELDPIEEQLRAWLCWRRSLPFED
jgi:hypothetical protein